MPVTLRPAVDRIVFRTRHREHVAGIVTLDTFDEFDADLTREIRVFSIRFLAAAPAGITENIYVRRPISQTGPPLGVAVVAIGVIVELGAALDANDSTLAVKQLRIPRSSTPNGFR